MLQVHRPSKDPHLEASLKMYSTNALYCLLSQTVERWGNLFLVLIEETQRHVIH